MVGNEVKVNVLNRPYGGFPWLDMPQYANKNWFNAHNFYGDLADIEAATLKDATEFDRTFYAPNNAALALVGDFDEDQARKWIEKYFGAIAPSKLPSKPDLSEPRQLVGLGEALLGILARFAQVRLWRSLITCRSG